MLWNQIIAEELQFVHPAAYNTKFGVHGGEDVGIWTQGPFSW